MKGLRSKRRSSPCIFRVVAPLSTDVLLYIVCRSSSESIDNTDFEIYQLCYKARRKSNCVKEVERLKKNREERRFVSAVF